MSITPQFTYDNDGRPIGVFLPIDEWNQIADELHLQIPEWQMKLMDSRLDEYVKDPGNTIDWDEVNKELMAEDEIIDVKSVTIYPTLP